MGNGKNHKSVKGSKTSATKRIPERTQSMIDKRPSWCFDMLDKDGPFKFCPEGEEFGHKEFLCKIAQYSTMTWAEINQQTHDRGKGKHHFLDIGKLSKEARQRVENKLSVDDESDSIFSFAFTNKLRIIGIRKNERFHVIWYDPDHQFCPSTKKHT